MFQTLNMTLNIILQRAAMLAIAAMLALQVLY